MRLSASGIQAIKCLLDNFVQDGAPGMVLSAVDKSGHVLVEHATGNLGLNSSTPMNYHESIFWLASCTKLVTVISVLQLVEQGKFALDDAEFVKKVAPEIKEKKVFPDGVNGVNQEKDVTVRMLLSHTAGFAYAFLDGRVQFPEGLEGVRGEENDILNSKLVNQPGSMWEYGTNMDWAGIILERVTGQKLGDYFAEHVFKPLGIRPESASMFPPKRVQDHIAHMHQRGADGKLKERDQPCSGALSQDTKEKQDKFYQSGGAGLWAKPKSFVKILGAILNDGKSPTTGETILKKESVDLLWENQIPNQYVAPCRYGYGSLLTRTRPNFARNKGRPPPANLTLSNPSPELYPQEGDPPQGWSYGGFLTIAPGATGRGANTLWWMGLANCFWWVDREKGVAGLLASQVRITILN